MTHYEIPTSPSPQVEAVLNYLDSIKVFDVPKLEKLFTDDFVQSTRPLSLETSSRTKADDLAFLQGFADQLRDKALEVIHCYPRLDYLALAIQVMLLWTDYNLRHYRVTREGLGPCT